MRTRHQLLIAPVTPFNQAGEVDLAMVEPLFQTLRARGADGFYLCGGTGEGMLLDVAERMRLAEHWRSVAGPRIPLIVHVGCLNLSDAQTLARHAAEIDAAAISSVTPSVFTPRDVNDLVHYFSQICKAAPETSFYYYHNSLLPGLKVQAYDFLAAARGAMPTLAGLKYTHDDLMDLSRCLRFDGGRYRIYYGKDECFLGAAAVGARDFIGGSFNLVSPLVRQAIRAFDAGDIDRARSLYHTLVDVVAVLRRSGGLPAVKAAMELLGVPCGPMRPPLRTVSTVERAPLFDALRRAWPDVAAVHLAEPLTEAVA